MITGSSHLDAVGGASCKISQTTVLPSGELPLFKAIILEREFHPDALLAVLSDGRWHTARELKVHGFNPRQLRKLVENSDGQIFSFPGSPGYKRFDFVTEEEFGQCASLKHEAERMLARYARYQARHHRGK